MNVRRNERNENRRQSKIETDIGRNKQQRLSLSLPFDSNRNEVIRNHIEGIAE